MQKTPAALKLLLVALLLRFPHGSSANDLPIPPPRPHHASTSVQQFHPKKRPDRSLPYPFAPLIAWQVGCDGVSGACSADATSPMEALVSSSPPMRLSL